MKFKKGDILEFDGIGSYAAKKGATAVCKGYEIDEDGESFIQVQWIRNELSEGQDDGGYYESQFTKVEEVSTQKEDRILIENEKDMKFEFEKGKILLMEYFQDELDRGEAYTLQTIKESDSLEDIDSEIDSFRYFKSEIGHTVSKINRSKTLSDVFEALIDTDLEDDDETVLSFFIKGLK
jgi:hypothetical protein